MLGRHLAARCRRGGGFYATLFGWGARETAAPSPSGKHYICSLRGRDVAAIGSRPEAPPPVAWNTYVQVEDAEESAARAVEAGGGVMLEPFAALDGGRIAVVADPAGAALGVWQQGEHAGAAAVNEPGAWAMSSLATADQDGARSFYRELFGWTTDSFGDVTLFRLPGFVGGEPEQPVPRDVVAVMSAAHEGAEWAVDFWTEDVERTANQAAELGGRVVAPPAESGVGTTAVLADPQGAIFSVSRVEGR